jgi:hypothetical protein
MKGYQMGKYKIRVKVEFVECDDAESNSPMKQNDGSFEMSIDGADYSATLNLYSIDQIN